MAQSRTRKLNRFSRRFGTGMAPRVAAAALVMIVVLVVASAWKAFAAPSFEIEKSASESELGSDSSEAVEQAAVSTLFVHVDGAVANPGVYELAEGLRVNDAIAAAGGLADDASTASINLAAALVDGQKINVPSVEEETAAASGASSDDASASSSLININLADASALCELPGVGEATAAAIIEDREANGPFTSIEDLMRVSGIGEKKFAKLESRICV